jgi:hypothetical protein
VVNKRIKRYPERWNQSRSFVKYQGLRMGPDHQLCDFPSWILANSCHKCRRAGQYAMGTMHRTLILLVFPLLAFPVRSATGETKDQAEAVIPLLDLLTSGEDSLSLRAAARQLAAERPPSEALADYAKLLIPALGREDPVALAGYAMKNLGEYIALHPAEFPNGLPDISGFDRQRQLGLLFDMLLPGSWQSEPIIKRLDALDPILNASWLAAAARCGAFDFHHLVRAHRGELPMMLLAYQESGDETGIIRLGEALGRYAEPAPGIDPDGFTTRSLALLLAGAFGVQESRSTANFKLVETALDWSRSHPDLANELLELRGGNSSLCWFEAGVLWERNEHKAALALLFSRKHRNAWPVASFVNSLMLRADPSGDEAAALIRVIPTGILAVCAEQLLDNDSSDASVMLALWMIPEYHSRSDRTTGQWIHYSMDEARKTALRWWLAGRRDDACRLLQEAFFNLRAPEHSDDLLRFAAIARAFGKEAFVMNELDRRARIPAYPPLTLHKAALLTVAGNHQEALQLARSRPPDDLFYRLLVECEDWDALREIAFGPEPRFKERHRWLCHAAFLNRDAAAARDYFMGLPEKEKEQTALLLLLSGNDELCRQHARKWILESPGYTSLPYPLSLDAFGVWELAILDDLDAMQVPLAETVMNYLMHVGMTRDKPGTIGILNRLAAAGKLRTKIGGAGSRYFSDRLTWQHRIRAARGLIDLGAVADGCRALEEIAQGGGGGVDSLREEFRSACIPARFATNGVAEYLKLAELELPAAKELERQVFLAKTLAGIPVPEAVRRMLGLLERHQGQFPFKDGSLLLQKLSIALWGVPGAEALRVEAERVFAFYQPDDRQTSFFQRWARPAPWQERFSSHSGIDEKPGDRYDPRGADFRVLDGMAEIRGLIANQRMEAAEKMFREMQIRILLDQLPRETIHVTTRTNQGSYGFGGEPHPESIPIIAAHCWNLQMPFLRDYALTVWRCGWNSDPRYLAPYLASNGDSREARIAAIEAQHGWGSNDMRIIRMLPAFDGLAHASEGRVEAALDRLGVCMNLSPFDPAPGMAILNALKQRGDATAVQSAAARIRDYWKQQQQQYPDSPQVREAGHYWLSELERFLR